MKQREEKTTNKLKFVSSTVDGISSERAAFFALLPQTASYRKLICHCNMIRSYFSCVSKVQ